MSDMFDDVCKAAEECGFSHIGEISVDKITLRKEARDMCAVNKCGSYGKTWSCPPGCGTLEECEAMIRKYSRGLLLQTTAILEDDFDWETMESASIEHKNRISNFHKIISKKYSGTFLIGGHCERCEKCTYPEKPCRFPDSLSYSLEGLGMIVSDVCKNNDIPYYYGPKTLTYHGAVLID
jgi:predicted metal-binding protein